MNQTPETGPIRPRKPWTAFNYSSLTAGLGQLYCGAVSRALCHLMIFCIILVPLIVALHLSGPYTMPILVVTVVLLLGFCTYSAWDAYRLARRTRPDYRLTNFNRPAAYNAFSLIGIVLIVSLAFGIRGNLVESFRMVGDSMAPTLENRELIFVRKDVYRREDPARQDLVVFRNPDNRRQAWAKRVVGLPGDTIECRDGRVLINGQAEPLEQTTPEFDSIVVPKNHIFVLGDNRDRSLDSRQLGPIPIIALIGKVIWRE
ncbi:MAG: signal peptidase I [Verrucomicrobiota bacterium]